MNLSELVNESVFSRRDLMRYAAFLGTSLGAGGLGACAMSQPRATRETAATAAASEPLARSVKRYPMKKSINFWAFPYPRLMDLKQCLTLAKRAGFDAVELNYNLEDDLSPAAGEKEFRAVRTLQHLVEGPSRLGW